MRGAFKRINTSKKEFSSAAVEILWLGREFIHVDKKLHHSPEIE